VAEHRDAPGEPVTADAVLVTGAFGLVGTAVVRRLVDEGRHVVATDLDVPGNRNKARRLPRSGQVEVRWADLTDRAAVHSLVTDVAPGAIVHLAAVVPPACYARPDLARKVNVEATRSLVLAASMQPSPPRLVLASSVAVYGARNPHRGTAVLTPATPVDPCDLYGSHKVEAEQAVRSSDLDWVILRLGGVLTPEPRTDVGPDLVYFEGLLPVDGRIQTVDVRDVARAFAGATTIGASREVLLIGGDETHRVLQGSLRSALSAAMGLTGVLPDGRRGDPGSDRDWFATDWMDTAHAQDLLSFQHHSLPDLLAETHDAVGWRRWALGAAAPLLRVLLRSRAPYRHSPAVYADPWGAISRKWGDPSPDPAPSSWGPGEGS
jgi:nucleoside-diphosphate-sugar epimerase